MTRNVIICFKLIFQAFRHFYVLAAEARWIQTVDVDTGLPVYAPLEVSVKESELYSETSFCEISPCILPERSVVSISSTKGTFEMEILVL